MPTTEQLKELQSKSLEEKIQISSARIIEWYTRWNGQVYVSFSGGKDSVVLLHLVRRLYPEVLGVYVDTGLEYPELREFVKTFDNIQIIRPEKTFLEVLREEGYPLISKEVSDVINGCRRNIPYHLNKIKGLDRNGNVSSFRVGLKKYQYLVNTPFIIGDGCCNVMKKKPIKKFEKNSGLNPILGNMVEESVMRKTSWLRTGCNSFNSKRPISTPIAFWTEQDVLQYIKKYNLEYASVYGELVEDKNGELHFTGCQRTGCVFCGFGCHLEKEPNRFQRLAETHPKLYNYCINGGEYNEDGIWQPSKTGLGMGKVLDYIGVNYKPIEK